MVCDSHLSAFAAGQVSVRQLSRLAGASRATVLDVLKQKGFLVQWRIESEKVEKVLDLLAVGASCREVAAITTVSKSSVHRIAQKHSSGRTKCRRCKTCGALITTPKCLACSIEKTK